MQLWLTRLFIFLLGVRFYKSTQVPIDSHKLKAVFKTFRDQEIYFLFYKETVVDTEYRFGSFRNVYSETIVIEANFNSDIEYPLMKFNGFFFLFKGRMFRWLNYEILAKVLLEIYIDHLEKNY